MISHHDIISWYGIMIWYHDMASWHHDVISRYDFMIWGSLLNSRHPDPRHVWKGGPELRSVDRIAGLSWHGWQRGWIPKSSKLMVYAVLEHPWLSQKWSEASRGPKCLTHIERSEIPGYKLPGWDATWGTCLEQSLFKMTPRRPKMKKMFFVISGGRKLVDVLKSKNQEENSF